MAESVPQPAPPAEADYSIPGLRIQHCDPSAPYAIVIRCTHRQEDWVPYRRRARHEPIIRDTTICYDGKFYRIHRVEHTPSGWVYRLKPWPQPEIMTRVVELTPEKVAEAEAEKAEFKRVKKLTEISPFYEAFLGFLPARTQNRLADRLLFSPEHASRKNAFVEFVTFFSLTALSLVIIFGYETPSALLSSSICFVLAIEGFVRWGHVLGSNNPCGLFLLEVIDWLYCRLRKK